MKNVWNKILAEIQLEVSAATFATLFKKTQLSSLDKNVATISCSSPILSNLIETRYYSLLKRALDKHLGFDTSIIFTTTDLKKSEGNNEKHFGPLFTSESHDEAIKKARLNTLLTFENFAVSSTNQLAFAAAQTVAQKTTNSFSPLFIYGGVGVGKTHLMQAIGNDILSKKPKTRIVYCAAEEFTNELIFAIRNRDTHDFKDKFRKTQVLLIDDVQFIAGKDTVQEEFFYTFNAILGNGGQIVLTSDKPPSEIKKLEKRLVSRFEGGLTVDIEPPDFALRTAILLIKARIRGIELPVGIAKILASNIENTRGLEGALTRLIAEAETKNTPIDETLAIKISGNAGVSPNNNITAESFLNTICFFYNLKPTQIKSPKRNSFIALPRHILMYLLRMELRIPLLEIGNFLGGRDHTTIMYGVGKIENLIQTSDKIRGDIEWIKRRVHE